MFMSISLENSLNQKMVDIFNSLSLDPKFAFVKVSDRPDLSDFQCNGALALAKTEKKNPREIATQIASELEKDSAFSKISVDGPGFLNLTLSDDFIAQVMNETSKDERFGVAKTTNPRKIVMDFGGPNVAKALHVGHLRSAVIGESIRRIEVFAGHEVISDVHLGDWGTQMGMILSEIILQDGDLSKTQTYNIEEISSFYKKANIRCKEDENAKEKARQITAELQNGNPEYVKAWQHLRQESLNAIKQNYEILDANFDMWLGESDAHQTCGEVVKMAEQQGLSEVDDGATIMRLADDSKPPVILVKSDGGFGYQLTDIATIKMRVDDLKAQEIIYVVDKRQSLHFEQIFEVAEKLQLAPNVCFKHVGFGTVNGADGKPFKTRDGGVMNLEDLINMSLDKVRESLPENADGYTADDINQMAKQIAIGAIKFQDLKNNTGSGYIFDIDDFAKFEGKTGPYIQYAIARINSILRKSELAPSDVVITNKEERDLALKIAQLNSVIMRAEAEKEPSIISDYTYNLAQVFSSFYNASPIMNEEDKNKASSRLRLAKLVRDILTLNLYLMGIEAPEAMLKK
ncbi:MAG: arginine--tRNA ligase [Alphaproteobacteria bacterium]|nr:arginine--tRNA ligase [Alphaproteobacteria bacterium]